MICPEKYLIDMGSDDPLKTEAGKCGCGFPDISLIQVMALTA
jgi:hypothetical protein